MADIDSAVFSFVNQGKVQTVDLECFMLPSTVVEDHHHSGWDNPAASADRPVAYSGWRTNIESGYNHPFEPSGRQQIPPSYRSDPVQKTIETFTFPSAVSDSSCSGSDQLSPTAFQDKNVSLIDSSKSEESVESADSKPRWGKLRKRRNKKPGFWTREEHDRFLTGLKKFGMKEYLGTGGAELLAIFLGSRTATQVKSHAQKHFQLAKQGIDSRTLFTRDK
mmetsp:Transcript_55451/g.129776  ORF Transcript_55451/g.129776 Transcript_55451/m.129776 type:complete len:221 (+) Transcript_55451:70-732(+)|eukprot:2546318-Rhodomonas_salina.1